MGLVVAMAWVLSASAQTARLWDNVSGGDFNTAGNWLDDLPPGTGDIARFNLGGTFTVTFGADSTVYSLDINDHSTADLDTTFDLGGFTLTLTSTSTSQQAIVITRHRNNTLRLMNGTLDVEGTIRVGQHATTTGVSTLVVGTDATMIQRGESRLANSGVGAIRVESNGLYQATSFLTIGSATGSVGDFTVTGPDARADFKPGAGVARDIVVGHSGTGTVNVLAGGRVINVQDLLIARANADALGTVRVEDPDSFLQGRAMYVGGTTTTAFGTGFVQVRSGGGMALTGAASTSRVYGKGTVEIDGGSLASDGHLHWLNDATYRLRLHAPGDIPMDIAGNVDLAMDSGNGTALFDLELGTGFSGSMGQEYTVLRYGGTLSGEFKDWTEGIGKTVGGFTFEIDYGSGTNDAITLTVIPEPGTLGLLLAASALLHLRRQRH